MYGPFKELFYPRQVVLVTASANEKTNVTAVEWFAPAGEKPPMVSFALHNSSFTLDLIRVSMEFVVAVPGEKLKEAVVLCGSTSGKFIDKFVEAGLTQGRAKRVSAPLIAEAYSNLECRVACCMSAGDRIVVIGEVVEAHPPKDDRAEPLVYSSDGKRLFGLVRGDAKERKEDRPSMQPPQG